MERTVVNWWQGHEQPRLIDTCGEWTLACVVQSNRRATVVQIAEEVNAGSDTKVSEYTVHHSLLRTPNLDQNEAQRQITILLTIGLHNIG